MIGREYHVETFFGVACLGCKQIPDIYETSSNRFSIFGITLRTAWSKHRFQRLVICIPKKFQQTTRPSKRSLGWQACATFFLNARRALGSTDACYEFRAKEAASPPLLHFAVVAASHACTGPHPRALLSHRKHDLGISVASVRSVERQTSRHIRLSAMLRSHHSFGALSFNARVRYFKGRGDAWSRKRLRRSWKVSR